MVIQRYAWKCVWCGAYVVPARLKKMDFRGIVFSISFGLRYVNMLC